MITQKTKPMSWVYAVISDDNSKANKTQYPLPMLWKAMMANEKQHTETRKIIKVIELVLEKNPTIIAPGESREKIQTVTSTNYEKP